MFDLHFNFTFIKIQIIKIESQQKKLVSQQIIWQFFCFLKIQNYPFLLSGGPTLLANFCWQILAVFFFWANIGPSLGGGEGINFGYFSYL